MSLTNFKAVSVIKENASANICIRSAVICCPFSSPNTEKISAIVSNASAMSVVMSDDILKQLIKNCFILPEFSSR